MSLNIKNERVHELAREAARRTGLGQTGAIEAALVQLLKTLADEDRGIDALIAGLQADIAEHGPVSTAVLYDEHGLPG